MGFYAVVTSADPLQVKYYHPQKGKVSENYHTLNEMVYDIPKEDLVEQVSEPKCEKKGRTRIHYYFWIHAIIRTLHLSNFYSTRNKSLNMIEITQVQICKSFTIHYLVIARYDFSESRKDT